MPCTPISLSLTNPPAAYSYMNESAIAAADAAVADRISYVRLAEGSKWPSAVVSVDYIVTNRAHLSVRFTGSAVRIDPNPPSLDAFTMDDGRKIAIFPLDGGIWDGLNFSSSAHSYFPPINLLLPFKTATRNVTNLGFAWRWSDSWSRTAAVYYGLGTSCGTTDTVRMMRSTNVTTRAIFNSLALKSGVSYYLNLRIVTGAGVALQTCSDPVLADTEAPEAGQVLDVVYTGKDSNSSQSPMAINPGLLNVTWGGTYQQWPCVAVTWGGFTDRVSSVGRYSVRVCEADGVVCLNDWSPALNYEYMSILTGMRQGVTYRVQIRAYDVAGNYVDVWSPGQVYGEWSVCNIQM